MGGLLLSSARNLAMRDSQWYFESHFIRYKLHLCTANIIGNYRNTGERNVKLLSFTETFSNEQQSFVIIKLNALNSFDYTRDMTTPTQNIVDHSCI